MKKLFLIIVSLHFLSFANAQTWWDIGAPPNPTNVTATMSNDTLYIKGTGQMKFWFNAASAPWYGLMVRTVIIEDGVTNIGSYAFHESYVKSVSIPNSVTDIGDQAFFRNYGLSSVVIPASVQTIGTQAFAEISTLQKVEVLTPIPPTGGYSFFNTSPGSVFITASLTVPCGALPAYQSASRWYGFKSMQENGCPSIPVVSNVRSTFSCPGEIEVKYDLFTACSTDVALYYSTDRQTYHLCTTVTGNLTNQNSGFGKTITWDLRADGLRTGFFVFKVKAGNCGCTVNSSLPVGKLTFLCYNLGADPDMTVDEQITYNTKSSVDATVYGDLYQWGRNTDGHEKRNSGKTNVLSTSDIPGHGLFITNCSGFDWRSPRNDKLWGNPKTANDPCPSGYRVPTKEEWESICDATSGNVWTWSDTGTRGFKISANGGANYTLFLPQALDRDCAATGLFAGGGYWSSTPATTITDAHCLNIPYNTITPIANPSYQSFRANGQSVRCVKEY